MSRKQCQTMVDGLRISKEKVRDVYKFYTLVVKALSKLALGQIQMGLSALPTVIFATL